LTHADRLRRLFGIVLLAIALHMIYARHGR
jgi:uncharacterized membrane protein YfcA